MSDTNNPAADTSIGILTLDTRFPRIPGDIGNPDTWPFPVHYKVVAGATPDLVVRQRAANALDGFKHAARQLVAEGVDGITTTCGFLSLFQRELAADCGVPVAASALMQYGLIQSLLAPDKRVGILTISAASLSTDHLAAAGVPLDAPVAGTDQTGTEFSRVILNDETALDVAAAEADLLATADDLVARHPDVGAILLECTNMMPYSAAISRATGLAVFDMYNFVSWFHQALGPRRFPRP